MIRRPPRSTQSRSSAASDVYKRQLHRQRGAVGGCAAGERRGDVSDVCRLPLFVSLAAASHPFRCIECLALALLRPDWADTMGQRVQRCSRELNSMLGRRDSKSDVNDAVDRTLAIPNGYCPVRRTMKGRCSPMEKVMVI